MGTTGRREREKAMRRQEILRAAKEAFFTRGFSRATIDDVAACAEVSKGTIYLYYESKEEILAYLVLEGLDLLSRRLQTAYASRKGMPAVERLRRLAHAYLRFALKQPLYFHLLMAFDRGQFREHVPEALYAQVTQRSVQSLQLVEQALEQGRACGQFAVSDTREVAGVLWASLNGVLLLLDHPLRQEILGLSLNRLFDVTLDMLINSLTTSQTAPGVPRIAEEGNR